MIMIPVLLQKARPRPFWNLHSAMHHHLTTSVIDTLRLFFAISLFASSLFKPPSILAASQ